MFSTICSLHVRENKAQNYLEINIVQISIAASGFTITWSIAPLRTRIQCLKLVHVFIYIYQIHHKNVGQEANKPHLAFQ